MPFAFEIQFSNFSLTQNLELGAFDFAQEGHENGGIQTAPASTLMSNSGYQVLSAYAKSENWLGQGWMDIQCTWVLTGATPLRFGVKLHFPPQVLSMGSDPYWYVMYDQNANPGSADPTPDWIRSGANPGDVYSWPTTLPLQIVATPTATGSSLIVQVAIQDWSQPPSG